MQEDRRRDALKRLSYIEGHVAGIGKMVEEVTYCTDILRQTHAVRKSLEKSAFLERKRSSLHLFEGKTQRRWNRVRPSGEIVAPHQNRLTGSKDTLVLIHIAYLVLHNETCAPDMLNSHPNLHSIGTHQRQHIGTRHFFDQYAIVPPIRACLNARVVRGM